jgi:hypothetical protein
MRRLSDPSMARCPGPLLPLLAALAVAACGGGADLDGVSAVRTGIGSPLLRGDGSPAPSLAAAVPADPGARTRQGRYATRVQADALEHALRGEVIRVEVGCCGAGAADLAVMTAYGLQAAYNLPDGVPVLVGGADLRLAAGVVDRLSAGGYERVFLVTR